MYKIFACSPEAFKLLTAEYEGALEPLESKAQGVLYPYKQMRVGHCFIVGYEDKAEKNKKASATYKATSLANKKLAPLAFKVLTHSKHKCIEVVRVK